jgi:glyoxylase-like metal-dependent hydrolase (beta-lactamase superfamily II)
MPAPYVGRRHRRCSAEFNGEVPTPQEAAALESAPMASAPLEPGRPPQPVRPDLFLFAPNRDSQGGSAWWLELADRDLLIDVPALSEANLAFLRQRAARRGAAAPPPWIVLTGREGHGRCRRLQQALGWPVLVQEQEAYLLPGVAPLHTFAAEHQLAEGVRLLWTPGPSPGACVLHVRVAAGGAAAAVDGLFCGRLLVPLGPGRLGPLISRRTFHGPRQLRSLERLRDWLPAGSPDWIASGAGLGALRGEKLVAQGAALLAGIDLDAAEIARFSTDLSN